MYHLIFNNCYILSTAGTSLSKRGMQRRVGGWQTLVACDKGARAEPSMQIEGGREGGTFPKTAILKRQVG